MTKSNTATKTTGPVFRKGEDAAFIKAATKEFNKGLVYHLAAWVHAGGDDRQIDMFSNLPFTVKDVEKLLKARRSRVLNDWIVFDLRTGKVALAPEGYGHGDKVEEDAAKPTKAAVKKATKPKKETKAEAAARNEDTNDIIAAAAQRAGEASAQAAKETVAKHTAAVPPVVGIPEAVFPQFALAYGKALKVMAEELKNDWKAMGTIHVKVLALLGDYLRGGCGVDPVTTGSWLTVHAKALTQLIRAHFGYTPPVYTPPKKEAQPKTERAKAFAAEQARKEAAAGDTGARVRDLEAARERNRLQEEAKAAQAAKAAEEKAAKKAAGTQPKAPPAPANKKAQARPQVNPTNTVYAGVALSPMLAEALQSYAKFTKKAKGGVSALPGKEGSVATMHLMMKKLIVKDAAKAVTLTPLGLKVAAEVK